MITGDLVKCNKTDLLGVVTQIVDKNPHTGNIDWIYRVLWTEPKLIGVNGSMGPRALSWERLDNFTPLTDEEYAV
jgi:hypothetical protein